MNPAERWDHLPLPPPHPARLFLPLGPRSAEARHLSPRERAAGENSNEDGTGVPGKGSSDTLELLKMVFRRGMSHISQGTQLIF